MKFRNLFEDASQEMRDHLETAGWKHHSSEDGIDRFVHPKSRDHFEINADGRWSHRYPLKAGMMRGTAMGQSGYDSESLKKHLNKVTPRG